MQGTIIIAVIAAIAEASGGKANIKLLPKTLEMLKEKYDVLAAESEKNLFDILCERVGRVSAVLLDMTENGGCEILKKIRSDELYEQIPVIAIVSAGDEEGQIRAMALGASSVVFEPVNEQLLLYTLENSIQLHEKSAPANSLGRDGLTGLCNRTAFLEATDRMLHEKEAGYYIISCFDIENFKVINDQYGIHKGDEVLRTVALSISKCMNSIGGISCRFMADKFGLMYPAEYKNEKVIEELYKTATNTDYMGHNIRIRVGRYLADDLSVPVSAMCDRATLAEESIKGRYDVYVSEYDDSMRMNLIHEQKIVNSMNKALENCEFEPWFQPQYNHATGALVGAEALVRWKKDDVFISPAEFIPVFERNGFIYEMDKYIWERVCMIMRRWIDGGHPPLPVSINISRCDVFHKHFVERITGIVKKYNLPFNLIRLEVTESAFADSGKRVIEKVNELIELGFTVEIDDFGSGYSSLNTLKDVPASILKLDMKFFENTVNTQRSGNIVESVVRMAKWLGMAVIAEGVEEKEQADYLKSIGCYYIQGYYYAKPMPLEDYEKLLKKSATEQNMNHLQTVDNLDNNEFWNPKSLETLIFNSYVGGACIFEFHNGNTELLRINEQYSKELGGLVQDNTKIAEMCPVRFLDNENKNKLFKNAQQAIATKHEASCELVMSGNVDGEVKTEYVRITVRQIASAGERYLFYCVIVNMTEQHEAEEKRREAEKRELESAQQLEIIMGNINGGVSAILIDDDGHSKFVFNNEKYYDLYGYTKQQAIDEKLDVMTRIVPEDFASVMKKIKKLKADRQPAIIDYRCIKRDGKMSYLRANSSMMEMEGYGGDVITSVVTDITEIKRIEDQLSAVVDNIYGGVTATVIRDGKPCFIVMNEQYFKMLGYSTREQYERECPNKYALIHPEDRERIINQFESSDGGKKQYTMEYRIVRRDGEIRYIQNNISVINIFGVEQPVQLSVANDVTEQRQAEKLITQTSDKLKTVMNNVGNGITAIALYEDKPDFLFANDKYFEIIGYSRAEYNERTLSDIFAPIYPADREKVRQFVSDVNRKHQNTSLVYRVQRSDKSVIWVKTVITITSLSGINAPVQIAVFSDITEQKEYEQSIHLAEEEYRLAIQHSGRTICRYNIADQTLKITSEAASRLSLPECIPDVPYGRVRLGKISPDTAAAYITFYENIMHGEKEGTVTFEKNLRNGWRWIDARFTTIFSEEGKPVSAIVSYADITEENERETIFKKWQQSLDDRKPESYSLFRCDLSKDSSFDSSEGSLINIDKVLRGSRAFDECTFEYAKQNVYRKDREEYIASLKSDRLIADYYRGKRSFIMDFRENTGTQDKQNKQSSKNVRWLRRTVDLVERPNSKSIMAYILFEDIDRVKKEELMTLKRSETDPLTGVLNRTAFELRVDNIIGSSTAEDRHAVFLMDADCFKSVNDELGHEAGDRVLIDITKNARSALGHGDLVGRLGGDEFLAFIDDASDMETVAAKAAKICELNRKKLSDKVSVSCSVGIAIFPTDGGSFEQLYKKVDKALYYVKGKGKNSYAFYKDEMEDDE